MGDPVDIEQERQLLHLYGKSMVKGHENSSIYST